MSVLHNPFDELGPDPQARAAAEALMAELRSGALEDRIPLASLTGPEGGKMFGVLVARAPDGSLRTLRAFSGTLNGRWHVDGFVPPLFDAKARAAIEVPGEAAVKSLWRRAQAHADSPEVRGNAAALTELQRRHEAERVELRERHDARRRARHLRREQEQDPAVSHALDQESRRDKAERRWQDARQAEERLPLERERRRLDRRTRALERLRHHVCRSLMQRLHDTYVVVNAQGERASLRLLYAPAEPPSGAGDCAGPKLLAAAYAQGLVPIALAEFWWGSPPLAGGRVQGAHYPACKEKCGPLLPFMLRGLDVAPARRFVPAPVPEGERALAVVYEDEWIVVIDKPAGLLSVPSRDLPLNDSVLERLRRRHPEAQGPLLVHRLDLDTSGLLVAALDSKTHAALQRQFAKREVEKRYAAWVEGRVARDEGRIELPLRVDLADRPRQIHDPIHGKNAISVWKVVAREEERTRVALFPHTGRTHQLRVHAAHPLGLNAPIVGDRLYGRPATRLLLHAESLSFLHPATGERVTFERPAPF